TVQGQRDGGWARFEDRFAVRPDHRYIRRRSRGLQSERRRGVHPPQCAAPAHRRQAATQVTTVTVVKKDGVAAIAADTLIKWGSAKESATYISNHDKILQIGDSFVGVTGTATFTAILRDYFEHTDDDVRLDSSSNIFRTWNRLHAILKERY